jgi:hypothetical protein
LDDRPKKKDDAAIKYLEKKKSLEKKREVSKIIYRNLEKKRLRN